MCSGAGRSAYAAEYDLFLCDFILFVFQLSEYMFIVCLFFISFFFISIYESLAPG